MVKVTSAGIVLLAALAISSLAKADFAKQFFDPVDGKFDVSGFLAENAFGFLPVPVVITEPAVDSGLGVIGLIFHEDEEQAAARKEAMLTSENAARHLLPPSVSAIFGAYTGNDSWLAGAGHLGFYQEGDIRYLIGGGYGDISLDYYSIGDVNLPRPLSINTQASAMLQTLKFKLGDLPVFIGPTQRYTEAELSLDQLENFLPPTTPPDITDQINDLFTSEITTSGLGVVVEIDTRDNIFSPEQGSRYELSYVVYREEIGSDLDYETATITALNYFKLSDRWLLGVRVVGDTVNSDDRLPPFAYPGIQIRGIAAARYQGSDVAVLESEVTWKIDSRWSINAFAGGGRAADSTSGIGSASTRVSQGAGFRYKIARRYDFLMGIDIAEGPDETIWYIQAGSSW
ncbi:hypothetical protein [Oceanicoccus sagamiensis]|uniref:Bacterial surface antigen (D15) domain-containing protein n=1 Tax=Oceanicoccus sagamiensis TaxID=716816 RepID=A0A1X9N9B2_9GAMM|nr:hypothetical protein [Oceanicoccus sagamiensis]ARN74650.1 hypothetical protein BST96_11260 [Oceanicoccus sagamiensis]